MPEFRRDEVVIQYEEAGAGPVLLLCAPGGMRSEARFWRESPADPEQAPVWIDPLAALSDAFRVIAMDQRNAGASSAPITAADGWDSFAADQLALLDHLGVERFSVMGGCIGCAFALGLAKAAEGRVSALVLQNPIGRSAGNAPLFQRMFQEWADQRGVSGETAAVFGEHMFGGDFVFSVSRDFVSGLPCPALVLPGDDDFHPRATALEIAALAPRAELFDGWRRDKTTTAAVVRNFLTAAQ